MADFDKASFARIVCALAPYLGDIVFVGGWAHRLFRLHPLARLTPFRPLMTTDADIAAPARIPARAGTIRELLLAADFTEHLSGDQTPPRAEYRLSQTGGDISVQFVTPLTGGEHRRDGSLNATTRVQGVTAEKLRYIDLLLTEPWTVNLSSAGGFPVGALPVPVRICNPVSYLAQKILSLPKRQREKRGKDVLYVHDTLLLFGAAFEELRLIWAETVRPIVSRKAMIEIVEAPARRFSGVTDAARDAAIEARSTGDRDVRVENLVAVCRHGLSQVFPG
jgi:hypothetical protein